MLGNIIFGEHASVTHDWTVNTDKFGNAFLTNESIGQKIRIGAKVEPKLEEVSRTNRVCTYNIPENIFISNNNKNMNVSIINYWKPEDETEKNTEEETKTDEENTEKEEEERRDDDIIYITLMNSDYKLLSYNTDCPIVATFKKRDCYNGLAIVVHKGENYNSHNIFTMNCKDLKSKSFVTITIDVTKDGRVNAFVYPIEDRNVIKECKFTYKKLGDKLKSFTINCGKFPTSTFIVDKNKVKELKKLITDIPNVNFIEVDPDCFSEKKSVDEKKKLKKLFTEKIVNARIRAVTTVGVKTPFDFCRDYKVLYLFSYDIDKDVTKCLKSN